MRTLRTALLVLVAATVRADAAPSGNESSHEALLARGESAFNTALELAPSDPAAARTRFAEAAAFWRAAVDATPSPPGPLWANLGNAYSLSGETGRAVAAFRHALEIDPSDDVARAGIAVERAKVGVVTSPSIPSRAERWLLSWRGHAPRSLLAWSALTLWCAGWCTIALRLARARRAWSGLGFALLAGGVLAALPLVAERWIQASREPAVVVQSTIAREGPSSAVYAPSFDRPLAPGVEVEVLEHRDAWARVRLSDGRATWVALEALECLHPSPADTQVQ